MKKSSALLPVILLLSTTLLAACGGSKPTTPAPASTDNKQQASAPAPASATDGSLDRVKKAGKLVIGMDTTYPPMEYKDKDGKTDIGFDVDLAKALAQKLGVQAETQTVDFSGIIAGLTAKRYDIIISSMNITPDRQKEANWIEYARMSQVFVSKKGVNVKTEADLAGKTVVVQSDTTSQDWVENTAKKAVKDIKGPVTFSAATDAFLALKNGRGDVMVIDEPVGLYYAKLDPTTYQVTGKAMEAEPVGVAIRKDDKDLTDALTKALSDLKADGTVKKLSQQWFGVDELGK